MIFSETDIKIFEAFCDIAHDANSRSEITISKIAAAAGMSRQAIYKTYYGSIDELINALHYYVDEDIKKLMDQFMIDYYNNPDLSFIDFLAKKILPALYEKRRYLHIFYGGIADPTWYDFMEQVYSDAITPLASLAAEKTGIDTEFLTKTIVAQVIAIISTWMKDDHPIPPRKFAKTFTYLLTHSNSELLSGLS